MCESEFLNGEKQGWTSLAGGGADSRAVVAVWDLRIWCSVNPAEEEPCRGAESGPSDSTDVL